MECCFMWHNHEYRGSAVERCSPRGIAWSIVTSTLSPWAIGHEYGLWRKVATMGASFVHDTIMSIVVSAAGKCSPHSIA
jgi:hypothetical protein